MKIAVPNNGNMVNQHFGMSKSFTIVSVENEIVTKVEEISTEQFQHEHEGLANLLKQHGVDVVITGGIGQGAINGLKINGLQVIRGASGEYMKVIEEYINGKIKDKNITCNHHGEHHNP
ncbi:NifB/NifX family molybdenum-iron cluster-binding protein [Candidatus Clostridium stratigraminis]|uniref:NifB/NifX family molybdenum-iron cluster-binding protein n=1 Tax=Candidatus Clostridium stratigraminis TaxID=3381661 RepID=A0ABW8T3W8_9CLOT